MTCTQPLSEAFIFQDAVFFHNLLHWFYSLHLGRHHSPESLFPHAYLVYKFSLETTWVWIWAWKTKPSFLFVFWLSTFWKITKTQFNMMNHELSPPTQRCLSSSTQIYKLQRVSCAAPVPIAQQMTPYWIDALDLLRCGEGTVRTNS